MSDYVDVDQEVQEQEGNSSSIIYHRPKPRKDRRTSLIWTKFTVVNKDEGIASCNVCGEKLCFKSTSHNLRKHMERKHKYDIGHSSVLKQKVRKPIIEKRPKLSELAGISEEGITVKLIGENGETEQYELIGGDHEIFAEGVEEHNYSVVNQSQEVEDEASPKIDKIISLEEERPPPLMRRPEPKTYSSQRNVYYEKNKRNRMMDLQIECLEIKKYTMQMEALMMEHQLNLPRSIFTETLRCSDTQSRGTQTEVGGEDTKVFYVTDGKGGRPAQQLFAFRDLE